METNAVTNHQRCYRVTAPAPTLLANLASVLACACLAGAALAQSYPAKTVRVVVPTGPGGGADTAARLMCKRLTETMGQSFFAENRPGASGIIGADIVAKSAPDGYTLLVTSSLIAISPALFRKIPFDTLKDFAPVSQISSAPQVLIVHPSVPAKSVKELVDLAKRQPRKLNAGSSGSGSVNHIAVEMLVQAAGISVTHVPYKSGASSSMALMSGEVDFAFTGAVQGMPMLRSHRARALAVTSLKPVAVLPGVPTMDSFYPGFASANWYAMFAPAGTPAPIVNRLHAEIVAALKTQEVRDFIVGEGAEPIGSSPQEFAAFLRSEVERYAKVVKAGNMKVD